MKDTKHIIWIPILLILSFLLFPLMHQKKEKNGKRTTNTKTEQTGFIDYDLLPEELKREMEKLQKQDAANTFYFIYFFENDDINHRYYITDAQHEVLKAIPVTRQEVFERVEEKIVQDKGKGHAVSLDERFFSQRETAHKGIVSYVLPEDKARADFSKLQVGILKMHFPGYLSDHPDSAQDTRTYKLSEVDQPPEPVRGMAYFKKVVMDEIKNKASFLYHDLKGEVVVEFTIGHKAISPQFVKDFAGDSTYEAYRAGGIILRAINDSKVHWKPAQRRGKPVNVRLSVTFSFNKQNREVLLSMSDIQEAAKPW